MPDKIQDKRKRLYDALVAADYDAGADFNDFNNLMDTDEVARQWVYDTAKSEGWKVGDNFEQFVGYITPAQEDTVPQQGIIPELLGAPYPAPEIDKPDVITKFDEGVRQGAKSLYQGGKYAAGEIAQTYGENSLIYRDALNYLDKQGMGFNPKSFNVDKAIKDERYRRYEESVDEWRKEKAERAEERKDMGFFKSVAHKWNDPSMPDYKDYENTHLEDVRYGKALNALSEALKEADGDVEKARAILEEKSKKEYWGEKATREASEELSKMKKAEGWAWFGQMLPQMAGQGAALLASASPYTRWAAKPLSVATTIGLTASSAGSAMDEARKAGATESEVLSAGLWQGGIEYFSEKIPLDRLMGKISAGAFRKGYKQMAGTLSEEELAKLLKEGNKRLGGKLLSGQTAKEFVKNVGVEAASEFIAEGAGTFVPIIYENEEDYPTLKEAFMNGFEGAKAGALMGGFLGGGSVILSNRVNNLRRKKQGEVTLAETENGVVEILQKDGDHVEVLTNSGELTWLPANALTNIHSYSLEEWNSGEVVSEYDKGYSQEPAGEIALNAVSEYNAAKSDVSHILGLDENEDVDAFISGRKAEDIARGDENTELVINNYLNKKAYFNGIQQKYKDTRDKQYSESDSSIDKVSNNGVVYSFINDREEELFITGGEIVLNENNTVDYDNSSEIVYVLHPDGRKEQTTPEKIVGEITVRNAEELKATARADIDNEWRALFDAAEAEIQQEQTAQAPVNSPELQDAENVIRGTLGIPADESIEDYMDGRSVKDVAMGDPAVEEMLNSYFAIKANPAGANSVQAPTAVESGEMKDESASAELPDVPDFFRLNGVNYEFASRNADGSVDAITDGKRVTIPAGTDYSSMMPTDKKGDVQYEKMPVERTHEHFVQKVTDDEARAEMIEKRRKKAEAERKKFDKKPDPGLDPDKWEETNRKWEEDKKAAQAKIDYWNEVAKREEEITRSETREAVENIRPDVMAETADEFIANHLPKITPESFKRETGLSNEEQSKLVGIISNDGVSVEQAAESIMENYDSELKALGFTGDMQDVRDIIIDVLSQGNPRSYAKKGREAREAENIDQQRAEAEAWAMGAFGMTIEELYVYEETLLPRLIGDYEGFDENEYYSNLAENNGYDTTRESESIGRGGEVLQGEQSVPASGAPVVGQRNEGGAVPNDVQGGGQNGTPQGNQQVSEPVGETDNLSSSEIPNNQSVAEGDAPGQSGVVGNNTANALQNGNNELNLQKENKSDNESNQNDIPVGGQVPQSVPQGEHGTQASQVSGAQETAARLRERIESAQGDSKSGLREVENRVTREFAQENGLWIEDEFKLGVPFPSGDEHNNYIDAENQVVYKVNNRMHTPSILDLLDRIEQHNKYFPDNKYSLVGFTSVSKNGDVMPVFAQDFVPDARMATVDEIDSYMGTLGFARVGDGRYSNGEVVIKDLKPRNVLADADGDIYVVDAEFEQEKQSTQSVGEQVQAAEEEVNTTPTDAQKEAGNYKKGHVQIGTFNVTIEQPKGSVRSGVDADGKKWETEIQNTYGYIRGTEGVDGDHIDVFLSDDIDGWDGHKVFVVDQRNADGSFDEHKVMLGFNDINDAEAAYMSNHEEGWQGLGAITGVSIEEFEKWIASSHRKTKAFAEYKSIKTTEGQNASADKDLRRKLADFNVGDVVRDAPYTIAPAQYTTKKGKVLDMHLVKFAGTLTKEQQRAAKELAKAEKGWYDREDTENVIAELSEPTQSVTASDVSKPQVPEEGGKELLNAETATTSVSEDRNSVSNSQENTQKSDKIAENGGESAENAPEIQEPRSVEEDLDNGDKRITNYNSRGEVATVAIERDGKVVSVDSYDEGVLFEHTEYDGNGKATSVTRYDKLGNVIGTQEYVDGKAKTPMQKLADRILDRTEEKRRIPLRERARELEAQVGVKANIIESFDEVKNREARERIAAGEPVAGWYSGGQVYLYMPNIKDKREIELTYVHEVVAHHGVKKLLGERFNEFLDGVWNMMSEADRARMLAYVGANENATLQDMRAAADEYVAELAEKMNLGELEQSTWEKIVDWFKELLENIGFENLTKDDIESMLKASYSNLRAESGIRFRKKDSELRQEKNRINNAIDTAAGFVTVGGKRQAIKNRLKREAERKELAKEIYSSVLKGDFNDVTLSQIDKFIEDATPANPFGRRISQRLPQRMERALRAYERTNAVDALFSRISESAVPANERFSEAGRREIEERKKELLKGWAIATGNWHTDLKEFTDDTEPIGEGQDSKVYSAKEGPFVIKASKGKPYGKRFRPDIDNIALFNDVFRNSRYEILGYGEIDGDFVRILKQRAVDFSNSTPLAVEERVEYMKSLGFEPINKDNTAFSNGEIVIADLQKSNIVRDVEGDIRVIDADAKLHTKDVGGDYTYPPVEEDLPEDSSTRFRKVTPEMDAGYMAAVENGDMETAERLVKEAAKLAMPDTKVVDEDGYPMVVYHESEEDFNVFDKTKGRANMDIQGMFFSPWDDDARGYGSNVRAFYLNITKPANESTGYKALNKFQGQNGAGIKAREYLVSAGYDGVNNEDQEFVAFDPNQIKSADAVTYDDNGNVIPLSERFNEEMEDIRFRRANKNQEVFVSNAQRAVEGIKQEKATPEQWIAMLKKNGGLKAGEEAWLGLEEWLNEKQGAVTKQEILDYIAQNRIQIEEVQYSENARFKGQSYYADRYNAGEADDVMPANDTRLNYTTDGLENKREIALVVPTVESWNASDEIHFGDAGNGRAVAWVRFGETTDSEGNRVLVIDEIQSKRHQEGREKGYKDDKLAELDRKLNNNARSTVEELDEAGRLSKERYDYIINKIGGEAVALDNELTELQQKAKELGAGIRNEEAEKQQVANLEVELEGVRNVRDYDRITAEIEEIKERMAQRRTDFDSVSLRMREINTRIDELINNYVRSQRGAVDAAPFEKNWHELAMKRMLRLAAEEGFDKVAWTTGEQQAQRYDIGAVVNRIESNDTVDYDSKLGVDLVKQVVLFTRDGNAITLRLTPEGIVRASSKYNGHHISDIVGKELGNRIMTETDLVLKEQDLRIGGEGMKGFYDKMLPSFVQKYTKKWGAKVGEVTMPSLEENNTMWSVDVTPEMQESVMQGQTMFRTVEETAEGSIDDIQAQPLTLMERLTNSLLEVSAKNKENLGLRADALRTFGRDVNRVLSLMKAQKEYDKSTVDTLVKLAKMYFKNAQLLGEVDTYTMGRVLSLINNVVGKRDVTASAAKLMDILLDAHTKALAGILDKAEKVKAKKVNAAGVEVMGRLDKYGQKRVEEYRDAKEMTPEKLEEAIYDSDNRLAELEQRVREVLNLAEGDNVDLAARDYTGDNDVVNVYMDERARLEGLTLAREYKESIQQVQEEIKDLKRELKQAEEDYRLGNIDGKSLKEFRKSVAEAIMESKAGLIEGYHSLIYKFQENTKESSKRAKAFAQAQIDRVREIQHNANSDMEGISAATQGTHPENYNNAVMNALRSPFPTFQGMLKKFGEKNVEGKGYLYERFIPQATKAGDNEFRGKVTARVIIEGKLKDIYGKKMSIAKFMKQLREYGATVTYREGNEMKQFDLTRGQMLYIYMVNKMADGQMKLRRMGITDDVVAELMTKLPEEAVQFADWAQNELLKDLRGKYNAVHERVFGAPMAAIENYFPIKIRKEARGEKGDVSEVGQEGKPSTVTGSIIKRTKNATAIDLSADAMQVLMEHIDDMEHWAAFAEFNRDLNVLLNYKHFQNQVKNMTSVRYGSGEEMWKNFKKTAQIVSGTYRPSDSSIDRAVVQNIAKGLTRSKINFRLFTAVKQLLSAPAFWTDAGVEELAYCYTNPKGSFDWALENLPGFAERWQGRTMGNEKLLKSDSDWKIWRNEFVEKATRWGMTPNAAIDALTVAQGARAVYMTKLEQFKKAGYTEQRANEKALQAAAEAYNESQQSSEGIYLSPLQVEGTVASAIFSTFKNSNFGYTRKTAQAIANIKRKMRKGYKEETIAFMTKQMVRDGLSEKNAKKFAEKVYNKSKYKDVANVAMFGFGLNLLWEAGGMAIYLLLGDDDEEKEKMMKEIALRGLLGLLNGVPFGETMISAAMAVKEGDTKYFRLPKLVAVGDIENLAQALNFDLVKGANDIVNMLTSMGVGVTPQVLTDILVAFGDVEELSAEELGMFAARFVNAPQSNLDRLMVDNAMENSAINAEEIMLRYAEYKKSKNAPITQFLYSDEEEQKAVERYGKRFAKLLDDRLENVVEDTGTFDLFYNDADAEMKKVLASMRKKHLAGDEADKFQKVSTKTILTNLLKGKDIDNVGYYKLTNADDIDEGFVVEMQIKELEPYMDAIKNDKSGEVRRYYRKELKLYDKLNQYQNDINEYKSKMKAKPEKADESMAEIRELRAKAINLINNYRKNE